MNKEKKQGRRLLFLTVFTTLFFSVAYFVFAAVVTIDSTVDISSNTHNFTGSTVVFTDDSIGYVFYVDDDGSCVYRKTTDSGATWGSTVTVDAQTDCQRIVVWYDQWTPGDNSGTLIHISTYDTSDDDVFYTELDTSDDSQTTTVNATGANQGGFLGSFANHHAITKGTDGDLYMGIQDGNDSFVIKCTGTCDSAGNWTEAGSNPFDNADDWMVLMPLAGGDILVINYDLSANDVESKVYDDSTNTWDGAWTTIDASAPESGQYEGHISATVSKTTNDIYLAYVADNNSIGGGNDDIRTALYSGGSWSTTTDVLTNDSKGLTNVTIALDTNTDDIYAVYTGRTAGGSNSANVYYKLSTDDMSTWGTETGPVNTASGNLRGVSVNVSSDDRVYTTWTAQDTDELYGESVANLIPPTPNITVDTAGTQISEVSLGANDEYSGGAFTFVRGTASANVTQIIINEEGSIDADSDISDLRVFYKIEATCSSSIPGDATAFNVSGVGFNSSDEATVTGTMSVGTSQVCVYLQYDVNGTAVLGDEIEFEISDPSSDLTVSAGTASPSIAVPIAGTTTVTDVAIDTDVNTSANSFNNTSPTIVFTDDMTGYAFYVDANNSCSYAKTTDAGVTWGTAVTVDAQTDCERITIWYDQWTPGDDTGDIIHISTWDNSDDDLWYTALDTSDDSQTTTVNASGAGQGGFLTAGANFHSITKGTDGDLYMGILDNSDSYVLKCTGTCDNAVNWSEAGTDPFEGDTDQLILMPLSGGNILAIQFDTSDETLESKVYDDASNTWDASWATIDADVEENGTFDAAFGATVDRKTGDILLAYAGDIATQGTDDDVRTAIYSSGSWSSTTDVITNDSKGVTNAKIAFDENTADVYVLYTAQSSAGSNGTGNIYYKVSTDGMSTWGAEQGPKNEDDNNLRGGGINILSNERLYAMWWNQNLDDVLGIGVADLDPPEYEQAAYRFFENDDSTDIGSAIDTQDTPSTLAGAGDAFRLRLLLDIDGDGIRTSFQDFKLQFVGKGAGTCAAPSGGTPAAYTDVTAGTLIAYNDNATPADSDALTGNANDPTDGDTVIDQTYEELNNFTNSEAKILGTEDGLWDFSLLDNGAPGSTSYCFRIVFDDGSVIDTYTEYPEITTGGVLEVDIVDAGGTPVVSPSVIMTSEQVSFASETSTGTLGVTGQRVRVTNTTSNPQWSLSIAADNGSTAFWDGTSADFDFNDPTSNASDGGDSDILGGQLSIDPSVATITPEGGCTTTGITLGSSSAFSEGVTDAITLASSGGGADTSCYWDFTDIDLSQTIPAEQIADSYSIDMVVSIIAI